MTEIKDILVTIIHLQRWRLNKNVYIRTCSCRCCYRRSTSCVDSISEFLNTNNLFNGESTIIFIINSSINLRSWIAINKDDFSIRKIVASATNYINKIAICYSSCLKNLIEVCNKSDLKNACQTLDVNSIIIRVICYCSIIQINYRSNNVRRTARRFINSYRIITLISRIRFEV